MGKGMTVMGKEGESEGERLIFNSKYGRKRIEMTVIYVGREYEGALWPFFFDRVKECESPLPMKLVPEKEMKY